MNLTNILGTVTKTVKQYAPEILLGVGVVGTGATVYTTYKAAPKVEAAIEKYENADKRVLEAIEEFKAGKLTEEELVAVEAPNKKELVTDVAKALAIPVLLGVGSIGSFVGSYLIQRNRIVTLGAAFGAVSGELARFKDKAKKELGDDKFKEMFQQTDKRELVIKDKDGKEKKVVEDVKVLGNFLDGVWFSESDEYASDNHEYNLQYVESVISQIELIAFNKNGIIMNEVLDLLSIDKQRMGALLGWTDDELNIAYDIVHIMNPETGMREPQIYIKWSTPKYIYDTISYDNKYYLS